MQKFFSISQYPGKTGQYFYHSFFDKYKIEANYNPVGTKDLNKTFKEITLLKPNGISISMPFKQEVIKLVNSLDKSVIDYNTCNTVKFYDEESKGFNADLYGVDEVCKHFDSHDSIAILGNGCMANMFKKYLNTDTVKMFANSLNNWDLRHNSSKVFINCTALGTSEKTSPLEFIPDKTKMIIDLSINDNNLKNLCCENNIIYFGGITFYNAQFLKQFEIYTDIIPDADYFDYLNTKK